MTAAFVHSKEVEKYSYPPDCPFKTQRAAMTREILLSMDLLGGEDFTEVAPVPLTKAEAQEFHTSRYIDAIQRATGGDLGVDGLHMGLGTPDNPIFSGLYEYSMLAAGASLTAARLLLDGKADVAFNPSGGYHHAFPERAAGFCYINDVVLACMELVRRGKKVAFLDLDVHHSDGVQAAFYDSRDVLTISMHENGRTLFPGTGFGDEIGKADGEGFSVNIPLPVGTYDEAYLDAYRRAAGPLLNAYAPDVIVVELGMDGLAGDPLAHLNLTNNAYADIITSIRNMRKPTLVTGGGGYHAENTARGWALAWSILCHREEHDHGSLGLGGVMLESTDWQGGLRDRMLAPAASQRSAVDPAIDAAVQTVVEKVFPIHGLSI